MAEFIALDRLLRQGRDAEHPVSFDHAETQDFAALCQAVGAWQAAFAQAAGQRFALYFDDSADFAAALLGAWQAGKTVYLPADVLPATLARLRLVVDGFAGDIPIEHRVYPAATPTPAKEWRALSPEADALVVYTSGSTGEPVAIPKRLTQLLSEIRALEQCFGGDLSAARVLATVSHQHIYGLLFRVLWPLSAGRAFAACRLAFPEDIAAALVAEPDCVLVSSPAHLKRLPEHLDWAAGRASLRRVFSSGGPLPDEAVPMCQRLLGHAPTEVYGSSETGGIAHRQRLTPAHTGWQTLPGVAVRINDGLLEVSSPHLPHDDWYTGADRAEALPGGFALLGRADRIAKIEEKRVSLTGLEQALLATTLVKEVRVIVLPGLRQTLAVVACPSDAGWALHDAEGKRVLNLRLREALAAVVEPSVLPRRWRYCWALPSDSQGKTREQSLQALFDPRRPAARLLDSSAESARLLIEVDAGLPFFEGHFPQAAILPGVAQLEWAVRFGRELFPLPAAFLRLEAVKFQQVIVPGSRVELALTYQPERAALGFKLTSEAGPHASGRIVFGRPE